MAGADTVWLIELAELTGVLREAGLTVTWRQECSSSHHAIAAALLRCYRADSLQIAAQIGTRATADLITSHRLWGDWPGSGRVRQVAGVAEKRCPASLEARRAPAMPPTWPRKRPWLTGGSNGRYRTKCAPRLP